MADNDLNDVVEEVVSDAEVITVPIDDTLSVSGEAADAKAVGDALANKADRSELQTQVKVNGQTADNQGLIILLAGHIPVSDAASAQTVAEVLTSLGMRTGADIPIDGTPSAETIAQALSGATARTADAIKMSSASDAQTVSQAMAALAQAIQTNAGNITTLDAKTGSTIKVNSTDTETIAAAIAAIRAGMVLKVNGVSPNTSGDVIIVTVPYAENLATEDTKEEHGTFIRRTTAGSASISDGSAWLNRMLGNSVHDGFVAESLEMTVIPITRPTPAGITAELDQTTFKAKAGEGGVYTLSYTTGWSDTPATWGVTVSGTPESGDTITITWDGEGDATMAVSCPRTPDDPITATIDRDTFVAYVDSSGTINLYFTTEWSADPELYGVTVTGVPVSGDHIQIVYVKEVRGTITQATPGALVGTGWNLYEATNGYARVIKYSDNYGYKIGGTWTGLTFKEQLTDTGTAITPDEDGLFQVSGSGYVVVTGGSTDTYILTTWSDWEEGPEGSYEAYKESTVSLSTIMSECFPNGLMKVGTAQDEIDRNAGKAISRVERQSYSAENRAAAAATGRQYDFDENYIYIERATAVETDIDLTGEYAISEHGMEFITGTTVPVYCEILYGENLKDKLRRDVVTVRKQTFTTDQKTQARENIGAVGTGDLVSTTKAGLLAADAEAIDSAGGIKTATSSNKGLMSKAMAGMLESPDKVVFNGCNVMSNAAYHNSIYRGKNLGTSITAAQLAAIAAGTFDDLFLGDYWVINSHTHTIVDFDYYIRCGDTELTAHHVVIQSDGGWSSKWYSSNDTSRGYVSTDTGTIRKYIKDTVQPAIIADFGSSHVLAYRQLYPATYSSGAATGWAWTDAKTELPNEVQVYGCPAWTNDGHGNGHEIGIDKRQLSLFRVKPTAANIRAAWWLRSVGSATYACRVAHYGDATNTGASNSLGVRPLSLIG